MCDYIKTFIIYLNIIPVTLICQLCINKTKEAQTYKLTVIILDMRPILFFGAEDHEEPNIFTRHIKYGFETRLLLWGLSGVVLLWPAKL